jgi:hypothetical protein
VASTLSSRRPPLSVPGNLKSQDYRKRTQARGLIFKFIFHALRSWGAGGNVGYLPPAMLFLTISFVQICWLWASLLFCFETGSCHVTQPGLELSVLLPLLSLLSAEILGMPYHTKLIPTFVKVVGCFFFFFFAVLGLELRA